MRKIIKSAKFYKYVLAIKVLSHRSKMVNKVKFINVIFDSLELIILLTNIFQSS